MAEPTEVIEQARRAIAVRREAERQERVRRDQPWRAGFVGVLAGLLLGVLLLPVALEQKLALMLSGVCAQQHNLVLGGMQLPLCARDTGMYVSTTITVGTAWARGRGRAAGFPPPLLSALLIGLVAALTLDGVNSTVAEMGLAPLYAPRNDLRMASGLGTGIALGTLLILLVNRTLHAAPRHDQPTLTWGDIGVVAAIDAVAFALALGGVAVAAWPLALLSALGVVGVVFASSLVAVNSLLGDGGSATVAQQLARPATVALLITGMFLTGTAALRAWLLP